MSALTRDQGWEGVLGCPRGGELNLVTCPQWSACRAPLKGGSGSHGRESFRHKGTECPRAELLPVVTVFRVNSHAACRLGYTLMLLLFFRKYGMPDTKSLWENAQHTHRTHPCGKGTSPRPVNPAVELRAVITVTKFSQRGTRGGGKGYRSA